jgi:hypothetical protein
LTEVREKQSNNNHHPIHIDIFHYEGQKKSTEGWLTICTFISGYKL